MELERSWFEHQRNADEGRRERELNDRSVERRMVDRTADSG